MTITVKRLAARLADENRRQAQVLNRQANKDLTLAKLQPWLERELARLGAVQKKEKAERLMRIADRLGRPDKRRTGVGSGQPSSSA